MEGVPDSYLLGHAIGACWPGTPPAATATTPQPFVGSPALQERLEEKVANLQTQQELQTSKETIKDLEEKLKE